jgi:hypothetical protein
VILISGPPLQLPLDADNTQHASAHIISSSKSSSISASKETRAAQREGITNSGTTASASSMQLPVHLVTNSPRSRNALPRALRENSSNISLLAPGPEESRKRNESPHSQEDSRSQRTVVRSHTGQADRTASVQPSAKPSTPFSPPSSSSETANTPHAGQVNRIASNQPSAKPSTSFPPPSSSTERRADTPHAEQLDRIAYIQPSAMPSMPSSPPFSSSERNATRPHADPLNRTTSSSVQPSIKPSILYPPSFSSSERNATRPHPEPVNRTASVQPPAKPSAPPPLLHRPNASISPSSACSSFDHDCDDDMSPPLVRLGQPPPRTSTVSSGDWPSSAVEHDEQTHPPPTTERDQTKQSMHSIPLPLPSNTMHVEVTAAGYVIVITKQSTSHNQII